MKERIKEQVKANMPALIRDIKTICSMDSRRDKAESDAPYGRRVVECLNKTLEIAKELGFETENVGNQVGIVSYGPDTEEYIAIVGHLDVVDINGVWKSDPFHCEERDGCLYARGVLDNKGPMYCSLYALKTLVNLHYDFPIKVQLIFGTNEETGMEDMKWYFKHHPYPKIGWTPDCKYPVVYAERGRAEFAYTTSKDYEDEFFNFINTYFLNQNDIAVALGIDYSDEEFGKTQVRTTHLFKDNDVLGIRFVISYPASYTLQSLRDALSKLANSHCSLSICSNIEPVYFPKDSYIIRKLEESYEIIMEEDGSAVTTTGGTYAKVVKNIVPFGPSFKGQKGIGHMPNEWMRIEDIEKNTIIYAYALFNVMEGLK